VPNIHTNLARQNSTGHMTHRYSVLSSQLHRLRHSCHMRTHHSHTDRGVDPVGGGQYFDQGSMHQSIIKLQNVHPCGTMSICHKNHEMPLLFKLP